MLFAQLFWAAFSQGLEYSQMLWALGELITRAGGLSSLNESTLMGLGLLRECHLSTKVALADKV